MSNTVTASDAGRVSNTVTVPDAADADAISTGWTEVSAVLLDLPESSLPRADQRALPVERASEGGIADAGVTSTTSTVITVITDSGTHRRTGAAGTGQQDSVDRARHGHGVADDEAPVVSVSAGVAATLPRRFACT